MSAPTQFVLCELVEGHAYDLDVVPRLASWDHSGTASQVALARYLDHVQALVASAGPQLSALHLVVDRPSLTGADQGHDLDNYVYPLVRRLGAARFELVRATKSSTGRSRIVVGSAAVQQSPVALSGWQYVAATTTGSADTRAWKQQIHDQLADAVSQRDHTELVQVELAFRIGPGRNWINLWKPTIDSLGPILGEGHRPFAPRDDRIVELGMHRNVDRDLKHAVDIGIWWKPVANVGADA